MSALQADPPGALGQETYSYSNKRTPLSFPFLHPPPKRTRILQRRLPPNDHQEPHHAMNRPPHVLRRRSESITYHRIASTRRRGKKEHTTRTTRQRYAGRTAGLARGSLTRRCGRCIARSRGRVFRGGTLSCVLASHGMFMDTGARTHLGEERRAPRRYTSQRRRRRTATRCDGHGRVLCQWSAGGNRGGRQVP